jgi:hypothetical protein
MGSNLKLTSIYTLKVKKTEIKISQVNGTGGNPFQATIFKSVKRSGAVCTTCTDFQTIFTECICIRLFSQNKQRLFP